MSATEKSITKEEAVEILASALSYCQQAGVPIKLGAANCTLWLALPGVGYHVENNGTKVKLVINSPENQRQGKASDQLNQAFKQPPKGT